MAMHLILTTERFQTLAGERSSTVRAEIKNRLTHARLTPPGTRTHSPFPNHLIPNLTPHSRQSTPSPFRPLLPIPARSKHFP